MRDATASVPDFQMERHHVTESVGNRDAVLSNELHSATEFHSLMDQPIFYLSFFLSLFFGRNT